MYKNTRTGGQYRLVHLCTYSKTMAIRPLLRFNEITKTTQYIKPWDPSISLMHHVPFVSIVSDYHQRSIIHRWGATKRLSPLVVLSTGNWRSGFFEGSDVLEETEWGGPPTCSFIVPTLNTICSAVNLNKTCAYTVHIIITILLCHVQYTVFPLKSHPSKVLSSLESAKMPLIHDNIVWYWFVSISHL
jgi:hypothetical protein